MSGGLKQNGGDVVSVCKCERSEGVDLRVKRAAAAAA